jgi:hypothetical protein
MALLVGCSGGGSGRAPASATAAERGATNVLPGAEQNPVAGSSFPSGAVLYGIGLSTDPYGSSSPDGFGVVTGLLEGKLLKTEVRGEDWCTFHASWLRGGRILVPRYAVPTCGRPVVFRYQAGKLEREGSLTLPRDLWMFSLSPNGRLVAAEPEEPCCSGGARASGRILVARADGSERREVARGHLAGWTPDGRVVLYSPREEEFLTLALERREETPVLARPRPLPYNGLDGQPRWSADGRYVAVRAFRDRSGSARLLNLVVIANARGQLVRILRSPYAISMFAWSSRGRRLASRRVAFQARTLRPRWAAGEGAADLRRRSPLRLDHVVARRSLASPR